MSIITRPVFSLQKEIVVAMYSKPDNVAVAIENRDGSEVRNLRKCNYSRTPLIRPPSESHWCGRIRGMVAREGFVYTQKPLSVTRNVVV